MIRVLVDALPAGGVLVLAAGEAHYLARVRRAVPGTTLELRDRTGRRAEGAVESVDRDRVAIRILRDLPVAPPPAPIHLLVAAPKRNLLDDAVRASSELGAARLTPLLAGRSVMRPGDGRLERWRRIADESMRQCGRALPLAVDRPVPLAEALDLIDPRAAKVLLHPQADAGPLLGVLAGAGEPGRAAGPVALAVGPEGGFEEAEVELAVGRGFVPASLGDGILRVETAAVAAVAVAAAFARERTCPFSESAYHRGSRKG